MIAFKELVFFFAFLSFFISCLLFIFLFWNSLLGQADWCKLRHSGLLVPTVMSSEWQKYLNRTNVLLHCWSFFYCRVILTESRQGLNNDILSLLFNILKSKKKMSNFVMRYQMYQQLCSSWFTSFLLLWVSIKFGHTVGKCSKQLVATHFKTQCLTMLVPKYYSL